MFESRVLGTEQGSYRVWCSMTPARGGLVGHSQFRTLDLDTESFPASQVQEALGTLSLCTFGSRTRPCRGCLQVCPGGKGTAREGSTENVPCGAPALLPGPAAEVRWEAHPGAHLSPPLLGHIPGPRIRIKPALGSVGERSGCSGPETLAGWQEF